MHSTSSTDRVNDAQGNVDVEQIGNDEPIEATKSACHEEEVTIAATPDDVIKVGCTPVGD